MREKEGYRDALERIRSYGYGEMLTIAQVAEIAYKNQPSISQARRKAVRNFSGWVGAARGKTIPATSLARQLC